VFARVLVPSPGWVDVTDTELRGEPSNLDLAIPPPALSRQLRGARIFSVPASV
jgi:hypothetical protein